MAVAGNLMVTLPVLSVAVTVVALRWLKESATMSLKSRPSFTVRVTVVVYTVSAKKMPLAETGILITVLLYHDAVKLVFGIP
jgi:hypothetical protein